MRWEDYLAQQGPALSLVLLLAVEGRLPLVVLSVYLVLQTVRVVPVQAFLHPLMGSLVLHALPQQVLEAVLVAICLQLQVHRPAPVLVFAAPLAYLEGAIPALIRLLQAALLLALAVGVVEDREYKVCCLELPAPLARTVEEFLGLAPVRQIQVAVDFLVVVAVPHLMLACLVLQAVVPAVLALDCLERVETLVALVVEDSLAAAPAAAAASAAAVVAAAAAAAAVAAAAGPSLEHLPGHHRQVELYLVL